MRRRWTKTSDKAGVQSFECAPYKTAVIANGPDMYKPWQLLQRFLRLRPVERSL